MGVIGAGLMLAGAAVEATGAYYEGKAAAAAASYNAKTEMQFARERAEKVRSDAQRIQSENIVRVAKSGVRLAGSPLSVLARNAREADRQAMSYIRAGQASRDLYKMQGRDAETASKYRMASSVLKGVGNVAGVDSGGLLSRSWSSGGYSASGGSSSGGGLYRPDFTWNGGY